MSSSLKFNAVMNMILTSSSLIFPLITVPYVSRVLTTTGMGAISFTQSAVTYFSIFAILGISTYGVRACAQVRDNKEELSIVVEELLCILAISTAIIFALYLISIETVTQFSANKTLFLIFGTAIWLASFGVEWFYQAIEQYGYITIRSIVVKLIGLILMFCFVHHPDDFEIYGAIVVFTGYGSNILNILRLHKFLSIQPWKKLNIKRHFKPMKSFFVSSVSSGLYAQADMFILGLLAPLPVVGIYQLVAKIKTMIVMAINSIVTVMLPRLSYYAAKSKTQYDALMAKNINFVILFSTFGIGGTAINANNIIAILGGKQYSNAVLPLLFILPAFLFVSLNTVLSQYLISSGHEKQYAIVNFVGLMSSIVYCLIFIPLMGAIGAALSCSFCELTALVIRIYFARGYFSNIIKAADYWKAPLSALLSAGISFMLVLSTHLTNIFMNFVTVSILYCIIFILLCCLFQESTIKGLIKSFIQRIPTHR